VWLNKAARTRKSRLWSKAEEQDWGTGLAVSTGTQPNDSLSFPMGGSLVSLRGETAGLYSLLDRVEPKKSLLVFKVQTLPCPFVYLILIRWGWTSF
jgi:hypothetical protein